MYADDRPGEARFDVAGNAWVLSRFADVHAALHEPRLVASGTTAAQDTAHIKVRQSLSQLLSPERLTQWRTALGQDAGRMIDALPANQPVDLVSSFAQPWSLEIALLATGALRCDAEECARLARQLFLAAAVATHGTPPVVAQQASTALSGLLPGIRGHANAAANVQTFVALSQTLPSLLCSAWFALLDPRHATTLAQLREHPELVPQAVGEFIRIASPSRAVFREALAAVEIGGARIEAGDRVTLMLFAANHDPVRFADPDRLDVNRETTGHLAFGAGVHACAGATLVRMAVAVATETLLDRTAVVELVEGAATTVEWFGGFAIRAPATLPVVVTREAVR